ISALLAEVWSSARREWSETMRQTQAPDQRTPTFIVVDEAHNLIPTDPQGSAETALRDQFRTIVAEGRKYGIFLILVTQRPDKVDPSILSECENKILMRLSSESVTDSSIERLGLEAFRASVKNCPKLKPGRALLVGKWPNAPQEFFVGARRTMEGGSNLREEHWAVPR
ncbi:MAG TPA: ATP-binding protein, partial [Longimicrobium sp.]|nr:ATP-binding protein [Longimicrobium sp.]